MASDTQLTQQPKSNTIYSIREDRFSESQMLRLAENYREHECLWDINNVHYRHRVIREKAYNDICQKMDIPGLTQRDLARKIKNLRSSYYQEWKKIEKSTEKGGPLYRPKVSWFEVVESYLSPFRCPKDVIIKRHDEYRARVIKLDDDTDIMKEQQMIDDTTSNHSIKIEDDSSYDQENFNSDEDCDLSYQPLEENCEPPEEQNFSEPSAKKPKLFHIQDIQKVNEVYPERSDDEFNSFGKYIAASLRSLPAELSIMARTELQKTISEFQLKAIHKNID